MLRVGTERIGIDAELLQPLALLLDAEAALRELGGAGPEDRPLLHEAAVRRDERDRNPEGE